MPNPPADAHEHVGRRHGSRLSQDEIGRRFRAAFTVEELLDRDDPELRTSEERELRRWRSIVAAVLDDVADQAAVFDELWNHFARPDAWRPFDDAIAVIPELVRRGFAVGVASNFDARLHGIIAAHFPTIRREHVFVSSELGHRKPSRAFFEACAARLQSTKSTLIGDDVDNDLFGARNAEWDALLIDRDDRHAAVTQRIRSLHELLQAPSG